LTTVPPLISIGMVLSRDMIIDIGERRTTLRDAPCRVDYIPALSVTACDHAPVGSTVITGASPPAASSVATVRS